MNKICITGRLVRDPELRTMQDNISVCSVTIAVDRRSKDKGADFIPCVFWRQQAEFVARYFTKGQKINIVGRIQVRDYTDKEGVKRYATEIVAEDVEFGESKREDGDPRPQDTRINPTVNDADISLPFDLDP